MFRALFEELIVPVLLFFILRAILKTLSSFFRPSSPARTTAQAPPQGPPVEASGELKKDPVCGTYVSTTASVTRRVNGQVVYFCSEECRDRYRVA